MQFADLTLAFLLSSNFVFTHVLGLGETLSTLDFSRIGRRSLVLLVVFLTAGAVYASAYFYVLVPLHLVVLNTLVLVLCLGIAHVAYGAARRSRPKSGWPDAREILYHTVLVGGVLLAAQKSSTMIDFLVIGAAGVAGYAGALVLLQSVLVRMARERIPVIFQGLPFQLFTAGLVWLILSGLDVHLTGLAP